MNKDDDVYDVIIIGAGWSGYLALKYCLAEGLKTLVLERRDSAGGIWNYTDDQRYGGVMKTTTTTSSRCMTEFSDFPMPGDYPDFPSHDQINAYLESYCEAFSLGDHIRLNSCVTRLTKTGSVWLFTLSDGRQYSAKNAIVCAGGHQLPNDISDDPRFAGFTGTIVHSAAVKEISDQYAGKSIIVYGGGESAGDIAYETSYKASKTYFCIPNGQWFLPKVVDRWVPFPSSQRKIGDHMSSRIRLFLSPTHRYSPFIKQYVEYTYGFNGHGEEQWKTSAPYNRSFFNKSSEVLARVKAGHAESKRDIVSCRGSTVYFTDGTSADVDYIITCTGYRVSFPFFEDSCSPGTDPREWFKYIYYNDDTSLAFVGLVRPLFGSIPGIAELQSRYIAKVFSGSCKLPNQPERKEIIESDSKFWNFHFRHTSLRLVGLVDHFVYCNQLAKLIGCHPKFLALFFSSPRKWWKAVAAPWNGCQFWLNDVEHHDRIFQTFHRYEENRISEIYVFLVLAPILPIIGLVSYLKISLGEYLAGDRVVASQPGSVASSPGPNGPR